MCSYWVGVVSVAVILGLASTTVAPQTKPPSRAAIVPTLFESSDRCQACHNGLTTPSGTDVSIGVDWRASMMAHSARDPYWHAGVRREVLDHPAAAQAIEHECSRCHMPMAHVTQVARGGSGQVFANLPIGNTASPDGGLAADGVSCTVCHQIQPDKFGTPDSFNGHFVIDTTAPIDQRRAWLHLCITAAAGSIVFESGAVQNTGAIVGNDNDVDPLIRTPLRRNPRPRAGADLREHHGRRRRRGHDRAAVGAPLREGQPDPAGRLPIARSLAGNATARYSRSPKS